MRVGDACSVPAHVDHMLVAADEGGSITLDAVFAHFRLWWEPSRPTAYPLWCRDIIDDKHICDDIEALEQRAKLLMLGMGQVGVTRVHVLKRERVDVCKVMMFAFRADVAAVLKGLDAGNLVL